MCAASALLVPLLVLGSPEWLSMNGVGPAWVLLWLLPWALTDGPISGAFAGLALGLILDGFWVHVECYLECFSLIFSIPFSLRFCMDFGSFLRAQPGFLQYPPCENTFFLNSA